MRTKKVAVFFGGRSPEHDVSIVTGLQVLNAVDPSMFDAFPVYVTTGGDWYVGDALRDRRFYIPGPRDLECLTRVSLRFDSGEKTALVASSSSLLRRPARFEIDFAIPAFHGLNGEDGRIQGLFEVAGVPYSGMRTMAAAVLMDKVATKRILASTDIHILPCQEIERPAQGLLILPEQLSAILGKVDFPCCVKPRNLGSSIGVAKVDNWQELSDVLPEIFRVDSSAILEPFVSNLVEYNISVCRFGNTIKTSAIERPKHQSQLLDFRTKYLSQGNGKLGGSKDPGQSSQGMLSLTRDINPDIPSQSAKNIRNWAVRAFEMVGGTGAPRIDFLCDQKTGEIWFNEVNPTPGSFAYFLWEAAEESVRFPGLIEHLISEGEQLHDRARLPADPTPDNARLFKRKP